MYKLQIVFTTEKDTRMSTGEMEKGKKQSKSWTVLYITNEGPPVIISKVIPIFHNRDPEYSFCQNEIQSK
jgi:hypothetical protein